MANPLTGDFGGAVQVSVPTLNRLLATMHQNGGEETDLPKLPHRLEARIGDGPEGGIAGGVRGTAYVQIGSPTVSLIAGAPQEARVSWWVRSLYHPDPGTPPLPHFVHGQIVSRFGVQLESVAGVPGYRAYASPNDGEIKLTDSNLAPADLQKVETVIRAFLRSRIDAFLKLADIPAEATWLGGYVDGQGRQALALPLSLGGPLPGAGHLGNVFLENDDLALAISQEFILSLIQPHLDQLKGAQPGFYIEAFLLGRADYDVTVTNAQAEWVGDGQIRLQINGHAKTPEFWAPNVFCKIVQHVNLSLFFVSSGVAGFVTAVGDPAVDVWLGGWHPLEGTVKKWARITVRNLFVEARDQALTHAQPLISEGLGKIQLLQDLFPRIDSAAALMGKAIVFSPDGIVLRWKVALSPRKAPVVSFVELGDGSGYSAYHTWMPGGRVKSYWWRWWRHGDPIPLGHSGPEVTTTSLHDRYILRDESLPTFPTPPSPGDGGTPHDAHLMPDVLDANSTPVDEITAPVVDKVIWDLDDGVGAVVGGQVCMTAGCEFIDPTTGLTVGHSGDALLDPALACSFPKPDYGKKWAHPKLKINPKLLGTNLLVWLGPDFDPGPETGRLQEVLREVPPNVGLMTALVLPIGASGPDGSLAARASALQRSLPHMPVLVADRHGPWLRRLELPLDGADEAILLVDANGQLAWRHEGTFEPRALAAALQDHLIPSRRRPSKLARPLVRSGHSAPDFSFEVEPGQRTRLRRLRGRRVALLFLPAAELGEAALQALSARAGEAPGGELLVLAIQDGDTRTIQSPQKFDYITVSDPQARIARLYGIQVRPTIVLVDWDGRVSTVQMMSLAGHPHEEAAAST